MEIKEIEAALEWAESFYENVSGAKNDKTCPKALLLGISALKIIIDVLKEKLKAKT